MWIRRVSVVLIAALVVLTTSSGAGWLPSAYDPNDFGSNQSTGIPGLEIPFTGATGSIIRHAGFSLLYNEAHEQASWVAYELTSGETQKRFERTDRFVPDMKVSEGSSTGADYARSGYDRGHLAPAGDMAWSATAMAESFYFSNISPQLPGFNRGIWKRLEEQVRTWAVEYQSVYIVTGPVLNPGLPAIGPNRVSVPSHFYKVILDYTGPDFRAIGFIMPNAASGDPLKEFAVSIDEVERITGLNFFPLLPDDEEEQIESELCTACWTWEIGSAVAPGAIQRAGVSDQCTGTTASGRRCRRMTSNPNQRCFQHGGK